MDGIYMNLPGKKVSFLVSLSESKVEEAEQRKTGGRLCLFTCFIED